MGPKKIFSDKEENRLIEFVNLASKTGNGILKCELRSQLDEFVDANNLKQRFAHGSPSTCACQTYFNFLIDIQL